MSGPCTLTLGEELFNDIEQNEYLNELYNRILLAYGGLLFSKNDVLNNEILSKKEKLDILKFADLLSKSNHPKLSGRHRVWSQEIISLMNEIYPSDELVKLYTQSVLSSCTNYYALEQKQIKPKNYDILETIYIETQKDYLKVPHHEEQHFIIDQKQIYDNLKQGNFSYSAPTSMGKSFLMRVFIRSQLENGDSSNYAILVPTKALISETKSKVLSELKGLLTSKNYRVVTSVGDIVLEQKHNFIFVMTPERLLHLISTKPNIELGYLFIDEAHKICVKDARSVFYYQLIHALSKREHKPLIYFSSPNIPNPDIYKDLIPNKVLKENKTDYAPVTQFKFLYDDNDDSIKLFNDHTKELEIIKEYPSKLSLTDLIGSVTTEDKQTIVYCSSLNDAIECAKNYSKGFVQTNDPTLLKIADDIEKQIHDDYYLIDLIKLGISFHVGYLPASIKTRIEEAFREGKIKVIFCTSTLIEGVNLPADNLIVTSYKNGTKNLDSVSFRNLVGRVGRLEYNLFGNIFIYRYKESQKIDKFVELLKEDVPEQKLSIDITLKKKQKNVMVDDLANGDIEISNRPDKTTDDEYQFMRKMSMLLIDNIVNNNEDSLVVESFTKEHDKNKIEKIRNHFKDEPKVDGLDLTYDQYKNLRKYIANGGKYPDQVLFKGEMSIDFNKTKSFLEDLYDVFKWNIYEKDYLANRGLLPYYASILNEWMSGYGLRSIMEYAIDYKKQNPTTGIYSRHRKVEDYYVHTNRDHRNLVYAEVLNLLEHMVLFSISNYFRAFSTEYKKQHEIDGDMDNDWYEYVEYGTMSSWMINLQRIGFNRESATIILNQKKRFIDESRKCNEAPFMLNKTELLNCRDEGVRLETQDISINIPDLFF